MGTRAFDGRPFAAGELRGLRAFDVAPDGMLVGPTSPQGFGPGENQAICIDGLVPILFTDRKTMRFDPETVPASIKQQIVPNHVVGGMNCSCGFYAYYNGQNTHARPDRVTAIIKGYGVCTVGTKGFRASKAALAALVLPAPTKPKLGTFWWSVSAALSATIAATLDLVAGAPWVAFILAVLAVLNVLTARTNYRRAKAKADPFRLTRSLYADVPVYETAEEAIAAHPLTVPEDRPTELDVPGFLWGPTITQWQRTWMNQWVAPLTPPPQPEKSPDNPSDEPPEGGSSASGESSR